MKVVPESRKEVKVGVRYALANIVKARKDFIKVRNGFKEQGWQKP